MLSVRRQSTSRTSSENWLARTRGEMGEIWGILYRFTSLRDPNHLGMGCPGEKLMIGPDGTGTILGPMNTPALLKKTLKEFSGEVRE